jgi:hypothetical protein
MNFQFRTIIVDILEFTSNYIKDIYIFYIGALIRLGRVVTINIPSLYF